MGSGIFFPVCAIPFSLLIIILLLKKEHIVNPETKIYRALVFLNFIGLIIEILCTFASIIYNDYRLISDIIYKTYLLYLIAWTEIFALYIFKISDLDNNLNKNIKRIIIIFSLVVAFFIYYLPIDLVLENNFQTRYTTGPSVYFSYGVSGVLVLIMLILIIKNFKNILNKKYIPVLIFFVVGTASIVIQSIFPQLLLLTYVETFICVIMYFTIENPDMKLLRELHKSKEISDNANEEKTLFIYNLTQDIRSISGAIDDDADYILDSKNWDETYECARNIKFNSAKFTTMTNEILDVSQVDSSNIKTYTNKYNIKNILKQVINVYTDLCKNKELEFRTNIDHDVPELLYGDGIGLKEVLTTILNNSVKYTNKGFVEFSVNTIIKNNICRLIITIEDSGIGIKSEDINEIKVSNTSLAKANKLLTLMNGTMLVSSEYGIGTKIKIILDQKIEKIENTETKKYEEVLNNIKILAVDDSEAGLKIIEKLLKGSKTELTKAMNGKECIDKIKTGKYDLILLDEELSQITADELIVKTKEIRNFETPVVLLTKDNSYEYNGEYIKNGFTGYILKPLKKEMFIDKINKYIEKDKK